MPDSRILAGAPATLAWQPVDSDGEAAAPEGLVTVGVARADGTTLLAAGTATAGAGSDPRTVALTGTQTAALDVLTATWVDAGGGSATTYHEVVGAHYFTVAEVRAAQADLASPADYPTAAIAEARAQVEAEFEGIVGFAFVPRYARVRIPGKSADALVLPHWYPRTVRAVWGYTTASAYTPFDTDALDDLELDDSGVIRPYAVGAFTRGTDYVVAYEHGWNAPPADVKRVALIRLRAFLNEPGRPIPSGATQFTSQEGTVVFATIPGGERGRRTGYPDVDRALAGLVHEHAPFA